jgi:hypothetical protein
MDTIINRIITLSGPLPDEALHRRWLGTLRSDALERRLALMEADKDKPPTPSARGNFRQMRQQILLRT